MVALRCSADSSDSSTRAPAPLPGTKPLAVVLTAYSIRASFFAIHALMRDTFAGMGGRVESGELIIREKSAGRALSTSLFSRWVA